MTRRLLVLALLAVCASAPPLLAQGERLHIRLSPTPNQTTKWRTAQDMVMAVESDAAGDAAPALPAMIMTMRTEFESTSAVGPTDDRGHYSAQMTVDRITTTLSLNGQAMPSALPIGDLEKRVLTFSYDEQGTILDVSVDGGNATAIKDMLKQLMTRAFATVAPMTLSVGESVTLPSVIDLPLPAAASNGALAIAGETRYTLTSVTFDGADRIAHLAVHTTSRVTHHEGTASTSPPMALDMTMAGEGTIDVNVDRGLLLHVESRSTLDTSM